VKLSKEYGMAVIPVFNSGVQGATLVDAVNNQAGVTCNTTILSCRTDVRSIAHMPAPIVLKPGDPCPACGGSLRQCPRPTDAQRAKAANKEDPIPLPPHYDTAPKEVVDELGPLWKCPDCGYPHRFAPAPAAGDDYLAPLPARYEVVPSPHRDEYPGLFGQS
jgi:hypothetical protein